MRTWRSAGLECLPCSLKQCTPAAHPPVFKAGASADGLVGQQKDASMAQHVQWKACLHLEQLLAACEIWIGAIAAVHGSN